MNSKYNHVDTRRLFSLIVVVFSILPHCMECQRGLATRKVSVCLFVRPSVKRVICDKTEKICPDFYTIRKTIYPSFYRRRMVRGGDSYNLKCWVKLTLLRESADFQSIFAHTASVVAPRKKVQLTLIGSPPHSFQ